MGVAPSASASRWAEEFLGAWSIGSCGSALHFRFTCAFHSCDFRHGQHFQFDKLSPSSQGSCWIHAGGLSDEWLQWVSDTAEVPQMVQIHYTMQDASSFSVHVQQIHWEDSRLLTTTMHTHREMKTHQKKRTKTLHQATKYKARQQPCSPLTFIFCSCWLYKRAAVLDHTVGSSGFTSSLAVAKNWTLELSERTEKVYKMHFLSTHCLLNTLGTSLPSGSLTIY